MENHFILAAIAVVAVMMMAVSPTYGGPLDITITLQGDTGLYLSRINRGHGRDPIEVAKIKPDVHCLFKVFKNNDGTYSFLADNHKFLSRYTRNGLNGIEAAKSKLDQFCKFRVIDHKDGRISLQADHGKWWSRINRAGGATGYNPVEASKPCVDYFSKFKVAYIITAGQKFVPA